MCERYPRFVTLRYVLWHATVLVVSPVSILCMGLTMTATKSAGDNTNPIIKAQTQSRALEATTKTVTIGFTVSLEMKENVDFLLTPALLVQEALCEDVVITYRSE